MYGLYGKKEKLWSTQLILGVFFAIFFPAILTAESFAQAPDYLDGPSQPQTLRTPLIPGQPAQAPYQPAMAGQPPAIGSGSAAPSVHPGDMAWGGPAAVPSGMADQSHGNMFPAMTGGQSLPPWMYVPGAGRRGTVNGQHQGVFEWGQSNGGSRLQEPGLGNGGSRLYEGGSGNGGSRLQEPGLGNGGNRLYEGGSGNGGSRLQEPGLGNGGARQYESGTGNGGSRLQEPGLGNGGARQYESGTGNGGSRLQEPGLGNGGARQYESGTGNGGMGLFEPGLGNGGASKYESGLGNGGMRDNDFGTGNSGMKDNDFGTGNGGVRTMGNSRSNGIGAVNNGGARADAVGTPDNQIGYESQVNRYEFRGPLPTVRVFARYLVILGVVVATVFVAIAGMSVVLGAQHGGSRVIGAVGGLLLLLAGYTIWKIVQMNTFNHNSTGVRSFYRNGQQQELNQRNGANSGPYQGPITGNTNIVPPNEPPTPFAGPVR